MHCDVVSCLAVVDDVRGGGMLLVTGRCFLFLNSLRCVLYILFFTTVLTIH